MFYAIWLVGLQQWERQIQSLTSWASLSTQTIVERNNPSVLVIYITSKNLQSVLGSVFKRNQNLSEEIKDGI